MPQTLTVELPDELAVRISRYPAGNERSRYAVSLLQAGAAAEDMLTLPDADEEDRMDALREGVAELRAGRLLTSEQAQAEFDRKFSEAVNKRNGG